MIEFKLNYYFEKYKDHCVVSWTKFKYIFTKDNGEFNLLPELFKMIQKYQLQKYGALVESGRLLGNNIKKVTLNSRERQRFRNRFGTKEERFRRKFLDERNL